MAILDCTNFKISSSPSDVNPLLHSDFTPPPNLLSLFQTGFTLLTPKEYKMSISSIFSK